MVVVVVADVVFVVVVADVVVVVVVVATVSTKGSDRPLTPFPLNTACEPTR